jgi:hypothetical protein
MAVTMSSCMRAWLVAVASTAILSLPFPLQADDERQARRHWPMHPPVTVPLGTNVSAPWLPIVDAVVSDWNTPVGPADPAAAPLPIVVVSVGLGGTNARECRPTAGRVEVCSAAYGDTGWLAVAQAWIEIHADAGTGVTHDHIMRAAVRFNDTYFSSPAFDADGWRAMTACHQIGHTLGLDHHEPDEAGEEPGTCMSSTPDPATNRHPDAADFESLRVTYEEAFNPIAPHPTTPAARPSRGRDGSGSPRQPFTVRAVPAEAAAWGLLVAQSARESIFEAELGPNQRLMTFVLWAR